MTLRILYRSSSRAYVLQLLLQEQRLRDLGLDAPDAWAGMFVRFGTRVEVAPDGSGFRAHYRPWRFINLPGLGRLLAEVADFRSRRVLNLPGPRVEWDTVVVAPSDEQRAYIGGLVKRADAIHAGGVDPHDDNMLKVTGDGRRVALDPALVGLAGTSGKVDALVARVAGTWQRTAEWTYPDARGRVSPVRGALQIVFCDQGTPHPTDLQVYGKVRAGLIDAGVPAHKIRFVHDATTDADRAQLFADCRAGRVAVLLGSTDKLGTGVNVQRRCVAIHHLDAPWRPTDIEQRTGRGDRPGNPQRHPRGGRLRHRGLLRRLRVGAPATQGRVHRPDPGWRLDRPGGRRHRRSDPHLRAGQGVGDRQPAGP